MREQIKKPYSQVLVWSGTVIGDTPVEEFNKFFKDEFGVRVNFIEEIVTSPDLNDKGFPIEGTGGRHDVFFRNTFVQTTLSRKIVLFANVFRKLQLLSWPTLSFSHCFADDVELSRTITPHLARQCALSSASFTAPKL